MALFDNFRQSVRTIQRSPGFAAVAILTIALGVGVNTAIFSVVNGILLRPLAFREPARLVAISETRQAADKVDEVPVNAMHFLEWRKQLHSFESLALVSGLTKNLTGRGDPERLIGARVSASLFPMLGVQPELGRAFRAQEDSPGANHVALLSHSLWVRRFQHNAAVLGQKIRLDGEPYQVIGILPADLPQAGTAGVSWSRERTEFWVPFALSNDELVPYGDFNYDCIGRLKPGVSLARALAELNALQAHIAAAITPKVDLAATVRPLRERVTGDYRRALLLLFAAVGIVLLIGCVNIANLMLARAAGRSREFAIRVAIGASRADLFAQSLTESIVLAGMGGAFGLMLTYACFGFLMAHVPADLPRADEVSIDGHVLLFGLLVAVATGVLCGLLPGWRYSTADPQEALKAGSHSLSQGRRGHHLGSALVSAEVALTTVSLVMMGLLLHSFVQLIRVDRGFDVQRVLTVRVSLPDQQYGTREQRTQFWRSLLPKVEALPGVLSVGISNRLPLTGAGTDNWIIPEGRQLQVSERPVADMRFVNPGYFYTLGVRLERGRNFSAVDQGSRVSVISGTAATALFGSKDPLGKRFHMGDEDSPLLTVIGVARDVRANGLQQAPKFTLYIPYWQRDRSDMALAVRTATEPFSVAAAVRREILSVDRNLPVPQFQTMAEVLDASVASRRFQVLLLLAFGGLALLLASLGIYGVVSYTLAQRTVELGIRLALGASPNDIGGIILRQGMGPVISGLLAGLTLALWAGNLVSSLLFGITGHDPVTLAGVALTLGSVAALACWLPVIRTMRIDPVEALRYE